MACVFQILLLSLALTTDVVEAACDAVAANEKVKACTEDLTKCSTDAGADFCALAKCSVDNLVCANEKYGEADCCKDLEAAFAAQKKAWDDIAAGDNYKDCKDEQVKFDSECGGGGASGAVERTTHASLFFIGLIAAVAGVRV